MHDAETHDALTEHAGAVAEPAERTGAAHFSRRAVGGGVAGAPAGLVGAAALADRSTPRGQSAMAAGLTAAEQPLAAATTYRLFGNRRGPSTAVPTGSKGLVTSLIFELTTGGAWL